MNVTAYSRRYIDSTAASTLLEQGIITKEESDYIKDCFVEELRIALEEKGFALASDVHKVPKSEILRRFRRSKGQAGA